MTGSQTNGQAVATMYGFALYMLPERFMLRRFAIAVWMSVIRFKGLNPPDWALIRRLSKEPIGKTYLDGFVESKNATSYHTDAKCCHASGK